MSSTLLEDLQALLNPLCAGGACYGGRTDGTVPSEYIVWLRISSPSNVNLSGASDLQNTLVQIDVFSDTPDRTEQIADAIRSAFRASGITNVPLSSRDEFEAPVLKYRQIIEYSVWATN